MKVVRASTHVEAPRDVVELELQLLGLDLEPQPPTAHHLEQTEALDGVRGPADAFDVPLPDDVVAVADRDGEGVDARGRRRMLGAGDVVGLVGGDTAQRLIGEHVDRVGDLVEVIREDLLRRGDVVADVAVDVLEDVDEAAHKLLCFGVGDAFGRCTLLEEPEGTGESARGDCEGEESGLHVAV